MIGELNIPTDTPIDFFLPHISTSDDDDTRKKNGEIAKLFTTNESKKKTTSEHQMILQNRRCNDGSAMNCGRPNKLWEDLFVRTFTAKLASTVDSADNRISTKLFNSSTTNEPTSDDDDILYGQKLSRSTFTLFPSSSSTIDESTTIIATASPLRSSSHHCLLQLF